MNITIGQYYPVKSTIHSLNSVVKLLATVVYITMLFFVTNFIGYFFVAFCIGTVIYASNVPPKLMFKGLRAILFIIIFTVFINIFFAPGETVIFEFYWLRITLEGLLTAVKMIIRLVLLIVGSSVLTLTTSPIELTDALEIILKPFKKIGLPSHEIAMMMTITLRFIPTLLEETDKIMKAQMARGADFDTGGLMKKAKSLIPLLVPLFISSFRRAEDLAMAMESRCYRGDVNRTRMKEMKLDSRDKKSILLIILFIAVVIGTRFIF